MTEIIKNPNAYSATKSDLYRKVKVTVEIALDCVPGWGDNVDDHIGVLFQNAYVVSAKVEKD